ncbi:MAG: DUF4214 domain-containing protein [Snowella sp.]|nr:DUF4214 domain-containing protein [Snowella sp.]
MTFSNLDAITGFYLTYLERIADPAGKNYWLQLADSGTSLNSIAASFGSSPEAQSVYPYLADPSTSQTDFINKIYNINFQQTIDLSTLPPVTVPGIGADPNGLNYWSSQLNSGAIPSNLLPAYIIGTASGTDLTALQNKIAFSQNLTQGLVNFGIKQTDPFYGSSSITVAEAAYNIVASVDDTQASVTAANEYLCDFLISQDTQYLPYPVYVNPPDGDPISGFYVSYYGRAGDVSGAQYWNQQLQSGMSLTAIAQYFGTSPEAQSLYSYLKNPSPNTINTFINEIYQNCFARDADASGLSYWTQTLAANPSLAAQFPYQLTSTAVAQGTSDANPFCNKATFAGTVTKSAKNYTSIPESDLINFSETQLQSVNSSSPSLTAANQALCDYICNYTPTSGSISSASIDLSANNPMNGMVQTYGLSSIFPPAQSAAI